MAKRTTISVRFNRATKWWGVRQGYVVLSEWRPRSAAIAAGRAVCRYKWKHLGIPCELVVHRLDGKIGKGRSSRSSYGKDPRRSRG